MLTGTGDSDIPPAFQSLIAIAIGYFAIRGAKHSYADPEWGRTSTLLAMSDKMSLGTIRKLSVIGVVIGFLIVLSGLFVGLETLVPTLSRCHGTNLLVAEIILAIAATALLLLKTRHRKLD
jgi:hypothetical protein